MVQEFRYVSTFKAYPPTSQLLIERDPPESTPTVHYNMGGPCLLHVRSRRIVSDQNIDTLLEIESSFLHTEQ